MRSFQRLSSLAPQAARSIVVLMADLPRMDRRARIREYRENERPMGVFAVRNTVSGRWLLGTSTDLPSMLNRQRAQLRMGAHGNHAMQADWNALGPEAFTFEILDELAPPKDDPSYDPARDLAALKTLWLEKLLATNAPSYEASAG